MKVVKTKDNKLPFQLHLSSGDAARLTYLLGCDGTISDALVERYPSVDRDGVYKFLSRMHTKLDAANAINWSRVPAPFK